MGDVTVDSPHGHRTSLLASEVVRDKGGVLSTGELSGVLVSDPLGPAGCWFCGEEAGKVTVDLSSCGTEAGSGRVAIEGGVKKLGDVKLLGLA